MWHCADLLDLTSGSDLPLQIMCFPGSIPVAWFIKLSRTVEQTVVTYSECGEGRVSLLAPQKVWTLGIIFTRNLAGITTEVNSE